MTKVSDKDIARAIYEASKGKKGKELSEFCKKAVKFLYNKRMFHRSSAILEKLKKVQDEEESRLRAKLTSAKKLEGKTKEKLAELLKKRHKAKEVLWQDELDEKILGGAKLETEDEIIDFSIKNRINKLKEYLTIKKYDH